MKTVKKTQTKTINLLQRAKVLGITKAEIIRKTKISSSALFYWETGVSHATYDSLKKFENFIRREENKVKRKKEKET